MLFYFLCCFVIVTSAFPENHIDLEKVTVAAEHGAGGRIAGGKEPLKTNLFLFLYQVQITREGATFCSGAVLNDRYILTAAHCVEGASPEELTVRVGSIIRGEGKVIPVEKIVQHPDYDYPQNNNDIAYIRTAIRIVDNSGRKAIRTFIANQNDSLPTILRVAGWGYQENNQMKLADTLRYADLPVISNAECQAFYPMMSITKNMICLYSHKDMDKGTCVGDGGGPATNFNRLVGVSSFSRGCGPGMGPSVFTYVDAKEIRNFIFNGTSDGDSHPGKLSLGPSTRPEKATKTPESDSKNPEECFKKVAKTPAGDSDYYEEHSRDASKRLEKHPNERPEKATKTPESDSKNPEECPEKVAKSPAGASDYYEEHPGDASKRPKKHPNECPEKVAKSPASDSDYDEEHPGDALKRPEKHLNECHEKVAKTPAGDSDYYEEHPGDASKRPAGIPDYPEERPGDLLSKHPEEDPAGQPEEHSKEPQRQPADRPQKRPAEREP